MCLVHFKIFFKKYFLVFGKEVGKEEGRGKTQKNLDKPRRTRRDLAIDSAISDRDWRRDLGLRLMTRSREASIAVGATGASRDRDRRRDLAKRRSRSVRTMLCARLRRSISRSFSLSFSLCASSLYKSPVSEIIWSENRNENEFLWSTLLFYGQLKMIFGKFNFPNQPNSLFYGKWFPETIFTQNKHSLRCCSLDSFQPCGFFSYRMKMYF